MGCMQITTSFQLVGLAITVKGATDGAMVMFGAQPTNMAVRTFRGATKGTWVLASDRLFSVDTQGVVLICSGICHYCCQY